MTWHHYPYIFLITVMLWFTGILTLLLSEDKAGKKKIALGMLITGSLALYVFTIFYWVHLARPPFKTMAETRLWYSCLIIIPGFFLYFKNKLKVVLILSILLSMVFLTLNLVKPENYDKTLMPALQSPWFIPHVVIYILGYAMLGITFILSTWTLIIRKNSLQTMQVIHNLVVIGYVCLSMGMVMGALWAKAAWGHYWAWDPKETWALISWLIYLFYLHYAANIKNRKFQLYYLFFAFIFVLVCWLGIKYLPSAQGSIHVYGG